ncbi:Membrane-bound lysozyme-inhibitor of c-type lysozyme [Roseivivax jejudonensis]|uniref:Membrane-bound lysozyme-inhibitor of c-type lysozyme n=1 Tax=Roseivivax jejudonensis TaxID=1529041 RepID=A0A1X6ZJ10_9RHOB|nr:MliC family protein [Roseivivax jejudonensis]SLN52862.1 Membrane-bound lysozyme-inhibitor of c-type lysozyme [Roseivivax jejudonensis]
MRYLLGGVCLIGLSAPVVAQEGPSFDCARAESSAETLICEDAELARLDRRVAERYSEALAAIRGLDAGAAEAESELRATQRGWIGGRDECWKAEDLRTCVADAYLRREGELVARWILEEPTSTAFWTCDGTPANEVVTIFFDTERPSLRFERGDSVDTGSLVPTGSGARYEGSFGRSIWIKGDAATYRDPDPDGTTYECTLARSE